MVALIPLIVCTERKSALTDAAPPEVRSSSSSDWVMADRCSLLSVRKRSAYRERSTRAGRWGLVSRVGRRAWSRRGRREVSPLSENSLHGLEHAARLERLDDEVLGACLDRLDHERLLSHRAAHQDARGRIELRDLANGIDAAHVRHHDVHCHEIGLELAVLLDGLQPGLGFADDLEASLLEDVADHRPHEDGVVADQDGVAQLFPL